jgi:hypothetical protein
MNVGHSFNSVVSRQPRLQDKALLIHSPNACQEHHLILQAQLRSNTNIMDRSLDRSLDDILGDRKQVRQTSPRSLFYRPIGIMQRLADSRVTEQ